MAESQQGSVHTTITLNLLAPLDRGNGLGNFYSLSFQVENERNCKAVKNLVAIYL